MAFKNISIVSQPVTEDLIEEFYTMTPSFTERELKEKRVTMLEDKVKAGLAVSFNWASAELNGKILRMNGQHSSAMLSNLVKKGELPPDLNVTVDHYLVDHEDDLALLFRQFDNRFSARSPVDTSGASQHQFSDLRDVPTATGLKALKGFAWYTKHIDHKPTPSGDDIVNLFSDLSIHPYILFMGDLISKKTPEITGEPILAAIYATMMIDETEAKAFWWNVVKGGPILNVADPTYILGQFLLKLLEKDLKLTPNEKYQGCIYVWNAYRQGLSIQKVTHKITKGKGLNKAI